MTLSITRSGVEIKEEFNPPSWLANTLFNYDPVVIFSSPKHNQHEYQCLGWFTENNRCVKRLFVESVGKGEKSRFQTAFIKQKRKETIEETGWDDDTAHREIVTALRLFRAFDEKNSSNNYDALRSKLAEREVTLPDTISIDAAKKGYQEFVSTFFATRQEALVSCFKQQAQPGDVFVMGSKHVDEQLKRTAVNSKLWTLVVEPRE